MPDDSDKKVIDREAEALGLKSRYALLCCHCYLFWRQCTILPVSKSVSFGHHSGIILALFQHDFSL